MRHPTYKQAKSNAQENANASGKAWAVFSDTSGAWNSEAWREAHGREHWSGVGRAERIEPARTPVMFRVSKSDPTDVYALFPAQAGTMDLGTCSIYAHVGQHSSADLAGCIRTSRAAKPEEYKELRAELERIGYALELVSRTTKAHRNNRAAQVAR